MYLFTALNYVSGDDEKFFDELFMETFLLTGILMVLLFIEKLIKKPCHLN